MLLLVAEMSGDSEKQLREHFQTAISQATCLMFSDEVDSIAPRKEDSQMETMIVVQLLLSIDDLALEKTRGIHGDRACRNE